MTTIQILIFISLALFVAFLLFRMSKKRRQAMLHPDLAFLLRDRKKVLNEDGSYGDPDLFEELHSFYRSSRRGKTRAWIKISDLISDLEEVKRKIHEGYDPQKIIEEDEWSEEAKQWASDYMRARALANKLDNDLQHKTTTRSGRIKI